LYISLYEIGNSGLYTILIVEAYIAGKTDVKLINRNFLS